MNKQHVFGTLFATLAIVLGVYAVFKNGPSPGDQFYKKLHSNPELPVAKVLSASGRWLRQPKNHGEIQPLKLGSYIFHLDEVFNDKDGRLSLEIINSGAKVSFLSEGRFYMEMWDINKSTSPITVHLISGKLEVDKSAPRGRVFLISEGVLKELRSTGESPLATLAPMVVRKAISLQKKQADLSQPSPTKPRRTRPVRPRGASVRLASFPASLSSPSPGRARRTPSRNSL